MNFKNQLDNDGVILVKDVWKKNDIEEISDEYDQLDKNLTNREIVKDKPIIVFWKHVVGEQKRICTLNNFHHYGNL